MGHQKKRQGNPRKAGKNKIRSEIDNKALSHTLTEIMKKEKAKKEKAKKATEFGAQLKEALESNGQGNLLVSDKAYNKAILLT